MTSKVDIYKVFGVAKTESNECRIQKMDVTANPFDDDNTDTIYAVAIETFGDAPELANIEIITSDVDKGKALYYRIVESWLFDIQRAVWFPNE